MRPTEKIENLIKNINDKTQPELDAKILDNCFNEMNIQKSFTPIQSRNIRSIIMHNKIIKPIAAAIIIIAGFFFLTLFDKTVPQVYAIEQTVEALKNVRNLRMSMSMGNQSVKLLMQINQQTGLADHIRMDTMNSGDITITIPNQTYLYKKDKNEVTLLPQELLTNDLNFKDVINSLIEQTGASNGRTEIVKDFDDIAHQKVVRITLFRQDESIAGQFLIDPESNLPLYIGVESNGQLNYMGPIEYNIEISKNVFEFTIPKNAKVIDNRPDELKTKLPEDENLSTFNLSETATAMKKVHNVHGIFIGRTGRHVDAWGKINAKSGMVTVMRLEHEDGGLYIITEDQTYFEDDGLVAVKEGQYMKCGLLFNDFISEATQKMQDQGMIEVKKEYSEEFKREVFSVDIKQPQVHLKAIVDMETKLPIKFSIPWVSYPAEPLDHTELIEYDVDLPSDFFDFDNGPDIMIIGKHLDTQFANDPSFGISYDHDEDAQSICHRLASEYLQARIKMDVKKIMQLHPIYISRYGSSKMIEKEEMLDQYQNGKIVEVLNIDEAYEYKPHQMMVPCNISKKHNGQQEEVLVGVIVYLREHNGQKSAVVVGYFPKLKQ